MALHTMLARVAFVVLVISASNGVDAGIISWMREKRKLLQVTMAK
jgi:hypothetical protein